MLGRNEEEPDPQSLVGGAKHSVVPTAAMPDSAGPREGPLILLFVVLTLLASGFVLKTSEDDAVKDPKQKAARGEVTGLSALSMMRGANLAKALDKVAAGAHPLVSNIRVAPDRVNLTALNRDGFRRHLTIDPGFGIRSDDAGVGEDFAVRTAQVDAKAPERMLRLVVAKTGRPASAVDYVTTSFSPGVDAKQTWFLAMKEGPARARQWVAEADGTDIRKPGELSTADKRRNRKQRLGFEREQRRLQLTIRRRTRCIQRARDATGVSKCLERYKL